MFRRCWLGLVAAAVLVTGVPGAASAADEPKLEVTAKFDKAGYQTGEQIKATVTIKNVTAQRLDNVPRVARPTTTP
ncbi:hypothetical protein [Actinocrispum sp. NPDC049592]|uniref:hypothetical protein n=1 Tax=Actinocrispum sp. NPDC049592 TaxID=3154835 RepID=UPI003429CDCA